MPAKSKVFVEKTHVVVEGSSMNRRLRYEQSALGKAARARYKATDKYRRMIAGALKRRTAKLRQRRETRRAAGLCAYCGQPLSTPVLDWR